MESEATCARARGQDHTWIYLEHNNNNKKMTDVVDSTSGSGSEDDEPAAKGDEGELEEDSAVGLPLLAQKDATPGRSRHQNGSTAPDSAPRDHPSTPQVKITTGKYHGLVATVLDFGTAAVETRPAPAPHRLPWQVPMQAGAEARDGVRGARADSGRCDCAARHSASAFESERRRAPGHDGHDW